MKYTGRMTHNSKYIHVVEVNLDGSNYIISITPFPTQLIDRLLFTIVKSAAGGGGGGAGGVGGGSGVGGAVGGAKRFASRNYRPNLAKAPFHMY